jgi:hypothetical protein
VFARALRGQLSSTAQALPAPARCDYHATAARPSQPRPGEVVARHPHDRLAHIEGKDEYGSALQSRAVVWARRRG